MRPTDEDWQDSVRNNAGKDAEGQGERKSFNPNFTSDNKLVRGGGDRRPRRRIGGGDSQFTPEEPRQRRNNYGNGSYQNARQGGYNGGNRSDYGGNRGGYQQRGYSNNGYNNDREGGYQNNDGYQQGSGGYQQRSGYQQRGGYQQQRGGYQQRGGFQQGGHNNRQMRPQQQKPRMPQRVDYVEQFNPEEEIRLNKFLANAGVCSRREADQLIEAGAVTVNGVAVTELGVKIKRGDKVMLGEQSIMPDKRVYILLNKPKDCVTTTDDPNAKLTVMDLVKNACRERIYPVGRLDRNTTGVLLLTNDGDLSAKLTHPQYDKKKIYEVALDRDLEQEDFDKILAGITMEDGDIKADDLSYLDPEKRNKVGIEIHSGRNRIVRRIFEHLGYKVMRLDRSYFAGLDKKNLRRGQWRFLTQVEVDKLHTGMFD